MFVTLQFMIGFALGIVLVEIATIVIEYFRYR